MVLETLKDVDEIGGVKIVVMDELREKYPDKFNRGGGMDWQWFEREIRPTHFIYIRHDKNSLSFTLQNGPIKEVGVNGCQIDTVIHAARAILVGLNDKHPCRENRIAIGKLEQAIFWLNERTKNREERGVEGTDQS